MMLLANGLHDYFDTGMGVILILVIVLGICAIVFMVAVMPAWIIQTLSITALVEAYQKRKAKLAGDADPSFAWAHHEEVVMRIQYWLGGVGAVVGIAARLFYRAIILAGNPGLDPWSIWVDALIGLIGGSIIGTCGLGLVVMWLFCSLASFASLHSDGSPNQSFQISKQQQSSASLHFHTKGKHE